MRTMTVARRARVAGEPVLVTYSPRHERLAYYRSYSVLDHLRALHADGALTLADLERGEAMHLEARR